MVDDKLINFIVTSFSHDGVSITGMEISDNVPTYYISVDINKIMTSLDNVLNECYKVLWILTYGKITDDNRDNKINMKYSIKGDN